MKRRWVYVMINFPLVFLVKIGIAKSVRKRKSQISKSMPGFAIPIFALPIPQARRVEQALHDLLGFMNIPYFGSGRTEWFFVAAAIPAIFVITLIFIIEFVFYVLIIYLILWLKTM